MSVKNVTGDDLALIELARDGRTDAPPMVLDRLAGQGFVLLAAGGASLTPDGRDRGERLKPMEPDLRKMVTANGGRAAVTGDAGRGFHVSGGSVTIRA